MSFNLSIFVISHEIDNKISKMVEIIRRYRNSYSKKQWILQAIYEKLDIEEDETEKQARNLLENILASASKVVTIQSSEK
jgi:hypothetical protein